MRVDGSRRVTSSPTAVVAAAAAVMVVVAAVVAPRRELSPWYCYIAIVAAVVVAVAVVKGEAMVVTSTLGRMVMTTSLSRTQWMQTR